MGILKNIGNLFLNPKQNGDSSKTAKYNFETVEEIAGIQIPLYSINSGISSPVNNIEYILQRKATEFKREGKEDLAIACLKKQTKFFHIQTFHGVKKTICASSNF